MRASRIAREKERFNNGWGIAASTLLHMLVGALVVFLPAGAKLPEQAEQSIDVEIVTLPPAIPEEKRELPSQLPLPQPESAEQAEKPEPRTETPAPLEESRPHDEMPAMVKPSRMLSEKVLADPQSRKARKELATLAPADQIEQLCGLEAMAQVGAWSKELRPDRIVAYAMADPKMEGNAFSADGAALHSKRDWFELKFRCELTPDHKKVAAFQFLIGDPIPRKDWADHSLPDEGRSLD